MLNAKTKAEPAPESCGQHTTQDYTGYGSTIRTLQAMGYSVAVPARKIAVAVIAPMKTLAPGPAVSTTKRL